MMKLAGIVLIVLCCLFTGGEIASGWKRRLRTSEALRRLVVQLEEDFAEFASPPEESYRRVREKLFEECGFTGMLLSGGWEAALDTLTDLEPESREILLAFAAALGRGSREQECTRCRHTAALLDERIAAMQRALPVQLKLCRSLALMAGAAAAIIMI